MIKRPALSATAPPLARKPALAWRLYRQAGWLAAPAVRRLLNKRLKIGKEDPARIGERLGRPGRPRPEGPLIWVHAASVGETMSILPLIGQLCARAGILLTTGTIGSAELAGERLPPGAIHQFVPVDLPGPITAFFDHWRPDLGIFCESEIWPGLVSEAHRRALPLGIVNGRMSEKSSAFWKVFRASAHDLLAPLAFCLVQSDEDARRYAALGAPARAIGNLKFDAPDLPVDPQKRAALRQAIGPRPVFVAASTHPGEEARIVEAARMARKSHPMLLTILVPRHPNRGNAIAEELRGLGESFAQRSQGALPGPDHPLYLADTLGELGLFYALADFAFIGGSLTKIGGHNPIEALRFGVPLFTGPHIANFRQVYAQLSEAVSIIADAAELGTALAAALAVPELHAARGERGRLLVDAHQGALAASLAALEPWLPRQPKARPA